MLLYQFETRPRLEEGVEDRLSGWAKRVVVFPNFLFTGKLYKRVMEIVRSIEEQHPEVPFRLTPVSVQSSGVGSA